MSDLQALSWSAPKRDYNKLRSSCGLTRVCSCAWGEDCKKAQAIFALNLATSGNDPLGRKCIVLDLSGKGPRKEKWRTVVLRNLGIKESSVKNLAEVPVAPHHWTAAAREHAKKIGGKGPATTYLTKEEVGRLCHVTDPLGSFTDDKGETKYFMIPNNPKVCWEADAKSLLGNDRAKRSDRRTQSAEKEERKKKRKEREKQIEEEKEKKRKSHELDKLKKPHEWRKAIKDSSDTIERQSNTLEEKDSIIEDLGNQLKDIRYQLQLEKKKTTRAKSATEQRSGSKDDYLEESCDCPGHFLGEVSKLIVKAGGASRLSLTNPEWYNVKTGNGKIRAKLFLGFHTWKEFEIYVMDLFPDVDVNLKGKVALGGANGREIVLVPEKLTEFEKCTICRVFFRCIPHRRKLASMFGVDNSTVGRAIRDWGPRWGKGGEQLSILIITPRYLLRERPEEYPLHGFERPGALTDGKDFEMEVKRNDGTLQRLQQSSKIKSAAGRCLTHATAAGLSFENTAMYAARYPENKLIALYGSMGKAKAPLSEWKDFAKTIEDDKYYVLRLSSGLENVDYGDGDDVVEALIDDLLAEDDDDDYSPKDSESSSSEEESGEEENAVEVVNIDANEISQSLPVSPENPERPQALPRVTVSPGKRRRDRRIQKNRKRRHQRNKQSQTLHDVDESNQGSSEDADSTTSGDNDQNEKVAAKVEGGLLLQVQQDFQFRLKEALKKKAATSASGNESRKRKRSVLADDPGAMMEEANEHVRSGPQSSPLEMLCQLETHERLHRHYQSGDLRKCMLSYYLLVMAEDRMRILHHLGSKMVPHDYEPSDEPLPEVYLRLAKIPPGFDVIADKGFDKTDGLYPWWNLVWVPIVLRNRNVKQSLTEEIVGKRGHRSLKRLRYTIEVGYSRVTDEECLKDVIPYGNIPQLQNMLAWGHANVNLGKPFRRPGWSPPGYWDDSD